jgi:bacterioferritin
VQTNLTKEPRIKRSHLEGGVERASFLFDVQTLQERVRQHIEEGAFTPGYAADRESVIKLLNEAMAIEIACVLRFDPHYFLPYADRVAERIVELGGSPNFCPDGLSKHAGYVEGDSLRR